MSEYEEGDIGTIEFSAERGNFGRSITLFVRQFFDHRYRVASLVWQVVDREGMLMPPAANLPIASAQQLMDELWRCGLRPSEGTGSAGSLAATERHLKDMREIAFSQLSIKVP